MNDIILEQIHNDSKNGIICEYVEVYGKEGARQVAEDANYDSGELLIVKEVWGAIVEETCEELGEIYKLAREKILLFSYATCRGILIPFRDL